MGCQGCFLLLCFFLLFTQGLCLNPIRRVALALMIMAYSLFSTSLDSFSFSPKGTLRLWCSLHITCSNARTKTHQHWPQGRRKKWGQEGGSKEEMQSYPLVYGGNREVFPSTETNANLSSEQFAKSNIEDQLCRYISIMIVFTSTVSQRDIISSDCLEVH